MANFSAKIDAMIADAVGRYGLGEDIDWSFNHTAVPNSKGELTFVLMLALTLPSGLLGTGPLCLGMLLDDVMPPVHVIDQSVSNAISALRKQRDEILKVPSGESGGSLVL